MLRLRHHPRNSFSELERPGRKEMYTPLQYPIQRKKVQVENSSRRKELGVELRVRRMVERTGI